MQPVKNIVLLDTSPRKAQLLCLDVEFMYSCIHCCVFWSPCGKIAQYAFLIATWKQLLHLMWREFIPCWSWRAAGSVVKRSALWKTDCLGICIAAQVIIWYMDYYIITFLKSQRNMYCAIFPWSLEYLLYRYTHLRLDFLSYAVRQLIKVPFL